MDHEPIHVSFREERVQVTVTEERLEFSSPLLLASPPGAAFGSASNRVDRIPQGVPTTLDRVAVPATSLAVKWLLFLADRETGLALSSEINALRRGGQVWFTEYAVLGDSSLLLYDLDVSDDGDSLRLVLTSRHDGLLDARTARIGVFH